MRRLLALVAVAVGLVAVGAVLPAAASAAWCGGTAESATDRPDTLAALTWHVVYAYPSDGADRFTDRVGPLMADLAAVDLWWRGQDPTRAIRWDLAAFPGCGGGIDALDLSVVRLARDTASYRGVVGDRWSRIRDDLAAAGFADPDKKVLVFYDGALDNPRECGVSRTGSPATGGGESFAEIYLDGTCGAGLGSALFPAVAAAHEMTHSMDALTRPATGQPGPPHACPGDTGHPCDSPSDLLYPSSGFGVALAGKVLDAGRDDYYGHSGSWWDVQDSPFLDHLDSPDQAPPSAPGAITARPVGAGTVQVSWLAATDDVGPVSYEVLRDGALAVVTSTLTFLERLADGEAHTYTVRPRDAVGRLGPVATVRFAGGLGVVDATGILLADTVPPSAVAVVRARVAGKGLYLAWPAATDAAGVAGYKVYRDGVRVATTRTTAFSLPASRGAGSWTVRAFDRAGNLGDASPAVVVAAPARATGR